MRRIVSILFLITSIASFGETGRSNFSGNYRGPLNNSGNYNPNGFGNNQFGGMGGGFGGMGGGFGGMGGGGAQSNGQSRKAAEEISKLGLEASKGIQENLKTFSSGQEKSLQNFMSSLKDTQVKEDNQKLLESLGKSSAEANSGADTGMTAITDNIVKSIDEHKKTRIEILEAIGQATIRPVVVPAISPGASPVVNPGALAGRSGNPLGRIMGLSGKPDTKVPSEGLARGVSRGVAGNGAYKSPLKD